MNETIEEQAKRFHRILEALGEEVSGILEAIFNYPFPMETRLAAAICRIGKLPEKEVNPAIRILAKQPEDSTRVLALHMLFNRRALEERDFHEACRDGSMVVRGVALELLRKAGMKGTAIGEMVLACVGDAEPEVRLRALPAALEMGLLPSEAISGLIKDPSPAVRLILTEAFEDASDSDLHALIDILALDEPALIPRVFYQFSTRNLDWSSLIEEKHLPGTILAIESPSASTRLEGVKALSKIGKREGIPALIRAMADLDAEVRAAAGEAVNGITPAWYDDPLARSTLDFLTFKLNKGISKRDFYGYPDSEKEKNYLHWKADVISLLACLKSENHIPSMIEFLGEYEIRKDVMKALASFGETAIKHLLAAINDPTSVVRGRALKAIAVLAPEEGARLAERILFEEGDGNLRSQAAGVAASLCRHLDPETFLLALRDECDSVRGKAARALAVFPREDVKLTLIFLVAEDEDRWVRSQALESLQGMDPKWTGLLGSPAVSDKLLAMLSDGDPGRRARAAWLLGLEKDPDGAKAIPDCTVDESGELDKEGIWSNLKRRKAL
jgi:HEAT repeat protein